MGNLCRKLTAPLLVVPLCAYKQRIQEHLRAYVFAIPFGLEKLASLDNFPCIYIHGCFCFASCCMASLRFFHTIVYMPMQCAHPQIVS